MENFRNQVTPNHHLHQKNSQAPNKATMEINKPIKVKYISNPMMVKANNESEFRAIVQKLTGQDSPHDAFDHIQSHEQFNHVFYPPLSTVAASSDSKGRNASVFGGVVDLIGVGEDCEWVDEIGSFSGVQASYDIWR